MVLTENRRVSSQNDLTAVAALLAKSLVSDPVNRYVFQDQAHVAPVELIEMWQWIYQCRLSVSQATGCITYGRFENDLLVSTLTIGSNENLHPSLGHVFQSGLWQWPFYYGIPSLVRFLETGSETLQKHQEVVKESKKAKHLTLVATEESHQGAGHAAELLKFALSEESGVITLDAQGEDIVKVYKKFGFDVVTEWNMLPDTPFTFRNYLMKTDLSED